MPRKKPETFCGSCDLAVKEDQSYVQCNACSEYLHRKCTKLSNVQFEAVVEASQNEVKTGKKSLIWCCQVCDGTMTDILSSFQKYKKMEQTLKKIQEDSRLELKNMRDEMDEKLEVFVARLAKCESIEKKSLTLADRVKKTEQKLNNTVPAKESEEQRDIERRKNNLILFGIPEPVSKNLEDKLEEEFLHINDIYKETVNLSRSNIKDMFRLGKKNTESVKKPRPLLVKFHDEESKLQILKVSGDLSLKVDNETVTVYASNDMTQQQRADIKKLRKELKSRKDAGEEGIGIRGNKIVNIQFFRDKQASRSRIIWATHIKNREKREKESTTPETANQCTDTPDE